MKFWKHLFSRRRHRHRKGKHAGTYVNCDRLITDRVP